VNTSCRTLLSRLYIIHIHNETTTAAAAAAAAAALLLLIITKPQQYPY
jgi:hypothetical protein